MPDASRHHDAHDYAERIRERLPRRLQELREGCGLSIYALWMKCGVSRDMISRIEGGETIPGVHVLAEFCNLSAFSWSVWGTCLILPRLPDLLLTPLLCGR
jgi:transcriptional regulator with XRE-family HTH domain